MVCESVGIRTTGAPGHRLDLAVAIRRQAASNAYNNGNVFTDAQILRLFEGGNLRARLRVLLNMRLQPIMALHWLTKTAA